MTAPKIGDEIYVPSSWYLSHGADDFHGGRAHVTKIRRQPNGDVFVEIEERPGHGYSWAFLAPNQEKLRAEYGNTLAHPDPDLDPDANRWD